VTDTVLSVAPIVVIFIGFAASMPYWTGRKYKGGKGLVFVFRRNAESCLVQVWMDVAIAVVNVVSMIRFWSWPVSVIPLLLTALVAVVGYSNWRMRRIWLRKAELAEAFEVSMVKIPDDPEGLA
jgi:hypothetical protein